MRDFTRIKRITDRLADIWTHNPDMRFTQLLINAGVASDSALWRMEDDWAESALIKFERKVAKAKKEAQP